MTNTTLRNIAIVGGIVLFVPAFVISPALGVVLAVILIGAFMAAQRILGASEVRLNKEDVGDLLNRMWIPVRDELSVVVRTGGRGDIGDIGVVRRSEPLQARGADHVP